MESRRMIATVLFTDIVGSTERATALGDRRWRELLRAHHAAVRAEIRRFHGQEVATAGDGFLAVFDSPSNALLCATAIRDAVRSLDLAVRCGVHMGEVEREDGDVGGIAVHIGARVAALAAPDEILASGTVRDAEAGSEFAFEDRGRHELKGVAGEWPVYALTAVPENAVAAARGPREGFFARIPKSRLLPIAALLAILFGIAGLWIVIQDRGRSFAPEEALADAAPGVAVLPFTVQGEGLDVWREGAVDLIGSNIDGAGGLRAIDARTLLARWHETVDEDELPDLATSLDIARRTGARYAVLGSAVALGRDLRLTADIYDVASGENLGQAQVQGAPDSVYMLVDRLSVETLKTILDRPVEDLPHVDLARATTASLPALRAYLEGEVLYRKADWFPALDAYRRAVAADSTFALAWLRVGNTISWLPDDARPPGGMNSSLDHAARFADRLPEREAVLVRGYDAFDSGSMQLLEPLESTTRRYPDDPELAYLIGEYYAHFGDQLLVDQEETARVLDHAVELDPTFAPYYLHPIESAFYLGDSARALTLLEEFEKLAPGTFEARRYRLAATLAWGTPGERAGGLATLEMLDDPRAAPTFLLVQPRFLEVALASAESQYRNGQALQYVLANLAAGRLEQVDQALSAGRGAAGPGFDTVFLLSMRQRGLPVDPERLRRAATADTLFPNEFFAAMLAAEEGRFEEVRREIALARRVQESRLAAGDSTMAAQVDAYIQMIEGYMALRRGERDRALELLQQGQRAGIGWGDAMLVNGIVRWSIAELLVELGRPEEAIPYFRSFRNDPYAALELGEIYEGLSRREEAKEQYEIALSYWRTADAALAPKVAEARQGLAGLGFQPRD